MMQFMNDKLIQSSKFMMVHVTFHFKRNMIMLSKLVERHGKIYYLLYLYYGMWIIPSILDT